MKIIRIVFYWLASFVAYFASVLLFGAVVGAILFVLFGAITHPHLEVPYRLAKGVTNGMMLATVWGPAIAIVLCFMQGHRRNQAKRLASPEEPA